MSVSSKPLAEQSVLGSFVKELSISVAEFEVILVAHEINGKNDPITLCLKIYLLCYLLLLI